MKVIPGSNPVKVLASFIFMIYSSQVNAECSRDDVTFYLDKGFTTDQVAALCSASSRTDSATVLESEAQNSQRQSVTLESDDNAFYLERAIKAKKIRLSDDYLRYTRNICIEYGEEDLFGFTEKVCPDVTYTILLKGLEVKDTGKKYGFYGTLEVRIKSTIKRVIIGDLVNMKAQERALVLEKFEQIEKGDRTAIPIRDDFSLEKVSRVLQELS